MSDALVYESSSMDEMTPNIFVKKDWLNIIDSNNGNYGSQQILIDSSALANSNKYLSYKEAYLQIPLVLTASNALATAATADSTNVLLDPSTAASSLDYGFGLKNWFGQVIHSMSLDFNGTTIIQATPFSNIYNHFKLMTSLSWNDVITEGASIGFFPDDPLSWGFIAGTNGTAVAGALDGCGTVNNKNTIDTSTAATVSTNNKFSVGNLGNTGYGKRIQYINYDGAGTNGNTVSGSISSALIDNANIGNIYKSYISSKSAAVPTTGTLVFIRYSIMATVYLKHLHNFFEQIPLMKGVFMRMTLNVNQSLITLACGTGANTWANVQVSANVPSGGTSPIMISSFAVAQGCGSGLDFSAGVAKTAYVSLCVGKTTNFSQQSNVGGSGAFDTPVMLYVPAYTFNAPYESAYISSPIKKIRYTDIYFYPIPSVAATSNFNQLLTNGIAGIKSVLVVPYYTQSENGGLQPYQSPFDTAPATTSPLAMLSQFQVLVGGQQMIYQNQRYTFEAFNNHLLSANSVNGGMTDGLTSGLIDKLGFENSYCYYYVNCSRMSDVERAYPKSVQIQGQNMTKKELQLLCFIEYEQEISVDILSGSRV